MHKKTAMIKAGLKVLAHGIRTGWDTPSSSVIHDVNQLIGGKVTLYDIIDFHNQVKSVRELDAHSVTEYYRKEFPGRLGMSIQMVKELCHFIDQYGLALELDNYLNDEL